MNFWFKKKKIILDCFTTDSFSFEYCKIDRAVKYYPQWWKELPSEEKNTNMKSCRGFIDLYTNSYVIPWWTTLNVEVGSLVDKTYKWSITGLYPEITDYGIQVVSSHNPRQSLGFTSTGNYQHIKLLSAWYIRSKSNVKFFYSDPIWHKEDLHNYTVLPGIVEYRYNRSTETNIMFEYKPHPYTITLTPGMPMAMITPLTEEEVELRYHLVSPNERVAEHARFADVNGNMFKIKKRFLDEAEERKQICPYKK